MTFDVESGALPLAGLTALAHEAWEEGFYFLNRLIADWGDGSNQFDRLGECLYCVRVDGELVAIGGLNIDPYEDGIEVGRIRRFYVKPAHRRTGVGRHLLAALLGEAGGHFSKVRLRTNNPDAAAFYESAGFVARDGEAVSHVLVF